LEVDRYLIFVSYNLAFFLAEPNTDAVWGLTAGFLAGKWAAVGFSIIGLFEKKSARYMLIDCSYLLAGRFCAKGTDPRSLALKFPVYSGMV